jgi:hypothetical protein
LPALLGRVRIHAESEGSNMTIAEFRRIALSLPEAVESAHQDHPDFRVSGKIFATLGYPDKSWGMVKLFPDQQQLFMKAEPKVFVPAKGAWGRRGSTCVNLKNARKQTVQKALQAAWQDAALKSLAENGKLL